MLSAYFSLFGRLQVNASEGGGAELGTLQWRLPRLPHLILDVALGTCIVVASTNATSLDARCSSRRSRLASGTRSWAPFPPRNSYSASVLSGKLKEHDASPGLSPCQYGLLCTRKHYHRSSTEYGRLRRPSQEKHPGLLSHVRSKIRSTRRVLSIHTEHIRSTEYCTEFSVRSQLHKQASTTEQTRTLQSST